MAVTVPNVRTRIADRPQIWPPTAQPPEVIGVGDGNATIFSLRFENYIPNTLTVYLAYPPTGGSGKKQTWASISSAAYAVGQPSPGPNGTAATNAIITFNPVATTSSTAVGVTGSATITPASMADIFVGSVLSYDTGANAENVTVTAVTPTTFTATFTKTHLTGVAIAGNGAPASGMMIGARCQVTAFSDTDLAQYLAIAQGLYGDDLSVLKRVQYDLIDIILMDQERLQMLAQGDYRKDTASYAASLEKLKIDLRMDLEGGPVPGAITPQLFIGSQSAGRYGPVR